MTTWTHTHSHTLMWKSTLPESDALYDHRNDVKTGGSDEHTTERSPQGEKLLLSKLIWCFMSRCQTFLKQFIVNLSIFDKTSTKSLTAGGYFLHFSSSSSLFWCSIRNYDSHCSRFDVIQLLKVVIEETTRLRLYSRHRLTEARQKTSHCFWQEAIRKWRYVAEI